MSKNAAASCDDCYFRRAGLCALVLAEPCPTFRQFSRAGLEPPRHPALVPRPASLQVPSPAYAA
ncbi:MAG: hypothetical protein ABR521_03815 [Gaiellaceae bacterium]